MCFRSSALARIRGRAAYSITAQPINMTMTVQKRVLMERVAVE